jgi:glutathione S-transferase
MILIGQYDSPFVRRVGIALRLYGMAFRQEPFSAFGDKEKVALHNPLMRVPALVLDDGESLIDSHAIIDYLDSLVEPAKRLFPATEPARHQALQVAALATGLADKAVGLFYELRLHEQVSNLWVSRCRSQIIAAMAALEARYALAAGPHWLGEALSHADIAVACCVRFCMEAHPQLLNLADYPAVFQLCARLEAMDVFGDISQAFLPPA